MSDAPKRYRGQRGPNKTPRPKMKLLSIRLPADVVEYYHGSSVEMRRALVEAMQRAKAKAELIEFSAEGPG